jgi:ribosomal protein S18 acetylase RimI-like enzyme
MMATRRKGETMAAGIRLAAAEDLEAIRRVARAAYTMYVTRIGREPAPMVADFAALIGAGQLWVAGDPPLGFVAGYSRGDHWHLENVAVDPAAQGSGLGRRLIAHAEAIARNSGARAVELYTNAAMTENQTLYPRLGYRETGRGVEDGFDRVFYRKELEGAKPGD